MYANPAKIPDDPASIDIAREQCRIMLQELLNVPFVWHGNIECWSAELKLGVVVTMPEEDDHLIDEWKNADFAVIVVPRGCADIIGYVKSEVKQLCGDYLAAKSKRKVAMLLSGIKAAKVDTDIDITDYYTHRSKYALGEKLSHTIYDRIRTVSYLCNYEITNTDQVEKLLSYVTDKDPPVPSVMIKAIIEFYIITDDYGDKAPMHLVFCGKKNAVVLVVWAGSNLKLVGKSPLIANDYLFTYKNVSQALICAEHMGARKVIVEETGEMSTNLEKSILWLAENCIYGTIKGLPKS